ncbi:hypothetical protein [Mycobacterium sp. HUMS_1102779]|uniref:hypothetical protein n=1 Tax=Mycobacterium sp. HUMS_1102779 TaxID=3383487 RepID=UPI00389A6836
MAAQTPPGPPGHDGRLREALRAAASALKAGGPRFALAGGYALWAYGAPEPRPPTTTTRPPSWCWPDRLGLCG